MSEIRTGGPAFPVECNIANGYRDDTGMTLRDYFAIHAPIDFDQACYAFEKSPVTVRTHPADERAEFFAFWARLRFEYADAMISRKYETDPKHDPRDDYPF